MVIREEKRGVERTCMMSKVFFDTNVLAYACDQDSPSKRKKARELLRVAANEMNGCVSTQVIQEFYVVVTGKMGVDPLNAKQIIQSFSHFELGTIDLDDLNKAIDGNILWRMSFWDALILVIAGKLNCDTLYSEDLNNGQTFDGVTVVNPF